ncbi:MAG: GHKL domain-containing protein [Eubacteriaceae bacterium]|nr:GHKL domain-containing protein [Eubacteriaceae bacterium]
MSAASFAVEMLGYAATILAQLYFFCRTMQERAGKGERAIASSIFFVVKMAMALIMAWGAYRPYISLALCIIYTLFIYEGSYLMRVAWPLAAIAIDGIVESAVISAYLFLPGSSMQAVVSPGLARSALVITTNSALFAAYWLCTLKVDKTRAAVDWRDGILLIAIPAGCWAMLEAVFAYGDLLPPEAASRFMAAASFSLLLVIASAIALSNRIAASAFELAQSKIQLNAAEMSRGHIAQLNELYERLSAVRHDVRSHLAAILSYLSAGEYSAAESYAASVIELGAGGEGYSYTGHLVLDALIGAKASAAKESGISFAVEIQMPEKLPITDVDLCILFSNLIENAFEADQSAHSCRHVRLSAQPMDSYWAVACRNGTNRQGRFRASGSIKSTKKGQGVYGIGTKQIQKIAEATGGFVEFRLENYEFSALAMLKMESEAEMEGDSYA